ncbi:16S rRNA (adenine1518-N6/adenine1519-N6)-dimethyltransferase [Bacilli bacterium PM5-9]|nr:16S rRNA (adenine1518-N6/adenine1519-N6)-dimethyltransferase [Bacilli bacterium PM5-9]
MSNDIATRSKTNELLKKYNLSAKKNFGQNFLVDNNIVRNIVKNAEISKETCVIEIGPGIGSLSQELARTCKKLVCIEIDERLKDVLEESLASYDNINIVFDDFLKVDLNKLVNENFDKGDEIVVVANLPYYITTPILIKIFEESSQLNIKRICAMMQKEVGQRLSAKKDTKDYNSLTILTQYYCQANIVMNVPKSVFIPVPNVDSVVVLFKFIELENKPEDEKVFFNLLRVLFKQRRKTILNNLNEMVNDKEKTRNILIDNNLDTNLRAENLTLSDIIQLSDYLVKENHHND